MRPDQERVRNLLIDTVTLLCKNSVPFKDELHVEGLLGVSVDKKDVFFVHISKEFTNSPSEGATVTQDTTDNQDEDVRQTEAAADHGNGSQPQIDTEADKIRIKTESQSAGEEECLIVEDPHIKLEGVASPAQMVAGQRRAVKRTSQSSSAGNYDDGSYAGGSGYGVGDGSNSGYGPTGEPFVKRRLASSEGGGGDGDGYGDADNSYSGAEDTGEGGQGWPTIAGMSGYDPSQQTFHDSDNSQMSLTDNSQPGCSSWTAGPTDSVQPPGDSRPAKEGNPLPPGFTIPPSAIEGNPLPPGFTIPQSAVEGNPLPPGFTIPPIDVRPIPNFPCFEGTDIPKYQCPTCRMIMKKRAHLVRHMRTHTGEKPYACKECDRRFARKDYLMVHMRVHGKLTAE